MPAELEEIVLDTDRLQAQHLRERRTEQLLVHGRRRPAGTRHELGCGQRLAVQFAVGGQRQLRQHHHGRGHHELRQPPAREGQQLGGIDLADHVGDQPVRSCDHRGPPHCRMVEQRRFDLARLHPETTDLDLLVGAAQEHHAAVRGPLGPVAGPVHPLAGPAERARHEPGTGQSRPSRVAAGQAGAGDIKLTGHAGRDRVEAVIEYEHPRVAQRTADRRLLARDDPAGQRVDRGLGGAVEVVARGVRRGGQLPPERLAHRLAAEHQRLRPVPPIGQ